MRCLAVYAPTRALQTRSERDDSGPTHAGHACPERECWRLSLHSAPIGADDPWHGVWTRALGETTLDGDAWTLAFDPVDLVELVREEGAQLWLAPGAPRAWLAPGQSWEVRRAATFFVPLTYRVRCEQDRVEIGVEPPARETPEVLGIWVRRPDQARMQSVLCNRQVIDTWSAEDECLSLPAPTGTVNIEVRYTSA